MTTQTTALQDRPEKTDPVAIDALVAKLRQARDEISRVVVGQHDVVEQLLIGLICGGHVLLEGAPGVGKTLLVRSFGTVAGLSFARIQFTPDLMPADVTGGLVLVPGEDGHTRLKFQPGPVFTEILLADEINRATPKTQAALLEAMQEKTVTAGGSTMKLPGLFLVLATQNPIEMEGTYRLPEAQIDRFLFKSIVGYPTEQDLHDILDLTTGSLQPQPEQVLTSAELSRAQHLVRDVPVASHVLRAVARFARSTQPHLPDAPAEVRRFFLYGLSPRGAQSLVLAAKGHALISGRYNVAFEDIRAVLKPTLRHRFQLNFEGEAEGIEPDAILEKLLSRQIGAAG